MQATDGFSHGSARRMQPVLLRLAAEASLPTDIVQRVRALGWRAEQAEARSVLQTERESAPRARYLVAGWAAHLRDLSDGRRLIFNIILPGDGLGVCRRVRPLARTTIVALTQGELVDAGDLVDAEETEGCAALTTALEALADADEQRMLDHMMRLGRLTALERLAHLLLDLHDRLAVVEMVEDGRFPMPLTQDTLGDLLGLSAVHVNRTLQELRRQDLVQVERGWARLRDRAALTRLVDYAPATTPMRTVA